MTDAPQDRRQALERLIAESLALSKAGLGRAGEPEIEQPSRKDGLDFAARLQVIRSSSGYGPGHALQPSPAIGQARARLGVALASLPFGERRRSARWPSALPCRILLGDQVLPALTLDIGAGGVMLTPLPGIGPERAVPATVMLDAAGPAPGVLMTDSDGVGHFAFASPRNLDGSEFQGRVETCAVAYEVARWEAVALANEIEDWFEASLTARSLAQHDLFTPDGYRASVQALFETQLQPLLAKSLRQPGRMAYLCATDQYGLVVAAPLDTGGTWSRHGRRFDDAVTLRAACFSTGPVVQTYRRQPGFEPHGVVSDVAAPVVVRGRRWGCVQVGRSLMSPVGE